MAGLDFLQSKKTAADINYCLVFDAEEKFFNIVSTVSPAAEVHLIASQMNISIGKHCADLLKELAHEVIRGIQDGVHWSKGARGFGARVTGCEQICLA